MGLKVGDTAFLDWAKFGEWYDIYIGRRDQWYPWMNEHAENNDTCVIVSIRPAGRRGEETAHVNCGGNHFSTPIRFLQKVNT